MLTPSRCRRTAGPSRARVDERADAAELLGLGDHVVDERRLARGLRAEDLDDAPARDAADAEREVQRQRAGRDRVDLDLRARVAHAHDGALAELALDLGKRALQRGIAGLGWPGFVGAHRVAPLGSRLKVAAHDAAPTGQKRACQRAGDGTRREREDFATKGARKTLARAVPEAPDPARARLAPP